MKFFNIMFGIILSINVGYYDEYSFNFYLDEMYDF